MLSIAALQLDRFKGITDQIKVGRLNLFSGPNGSGKSARLQAVTWGITGTTPIGAQVTTAIKYGDAEGCLVGLDLNDGFSWVRSLTPGKDKINHSVVVSGKETLGIDDSIREIEAHVGDFAPQFDLKEFLKLSDDKQRAFALALCGKAVPPISAADVIRRMRFELCVVKHGDTTVNTVIGTRFGCLRSDLDTAEQNEIADMLLAQVADPYRTAVDAHLMEMQAVLLGDDATTAIGAAIEKAGELANAAKRARDNAQKASRKVSEDKNLVPVVALTMQQINDELAKLKTDREMLIGQIQHQKGRIAAKDSLERQIAGKQQAVTQRRLDLEKLREQGGALQADIDAIEVPTIRDAEIKVEEYVRAEADAKLAYATAQEKAKSARSELTDKQAANIKGRKNPWSEMNALVRELGELEPFHADNYSGAVLHLVSRMKQLIEKSKPEYPSDADVAAVKARVEQLDADLQGPRAEAVRQASANLQQARVELEKLRMQRERTINRQQMLKDEKRNMLSEADQKETLIAQLEAELLQLSQEMDKLRADGGFVPPDELEAQLARLDQHGKELAVKKENKTRFQHLEAELQKLVSDSEREELSHDAGKDLVAALKAVRDTLMHDVVKPMIGKIDKWLGAAWPTAKAYVELVNDKNKPIFGLGWIDNGKKIALEAMCGGEEAVFKGGLAYALVALHDCPLKVLMLEASEVDAAHLPHLIRGCTEVIDELSNVFIATHLPVGKKVKEALTSDWNVEKLAELATANS